MTIRFAAATTGALSARRLPACEPIARALVAQCIEQVSNDNAPSPGARSLNDEILRAALEHFAEHGLSAAHVAKVNAEAAALAKDKKAFERWLGIARTFDRRMATEIERNTP